MPGMTGLELLPKAKAARPDVQVIMITAYGDDSTRRKALDGGAEALLTAHRFCCASRRNRQPSGWGWSRGPLRVNRVILVIGQLLPVFSRKRTFSAAVGMSQKCQHRKSPFSFDHLIGATEQHRWHFEAERFSSLEVDYEIELLRPLYR